MVYICSSSGFPNGPWPQLPASDSNSSQWLNPSSPLTATAKWSCLWRPGMDYIENTTSHYWCILLLPWKHACLESRYLATDIVYLLILWLPSNGSTCHNMLNNLYLKNRVIHSVMPYSPIEVLQRFGGISWITQHYIPQDIILHSH
jgi:hypothetical protein